MEFSLVGVLIKPNKVKNVLDHSGLSEKQTTVIVLNKPCTKIVL